MILEHILLVLVQHLGTISFGEFSAVLQQSNPVPCDEPGSTEAAGMDASDNVHQFTKSSSHSLLAG